MRMARVLTGFKNTNDSFLKRSGLTLTSEVGQEQKQQTQVFVRFYNITILVILQIGNDQLPML